MSVENIEITRSLDQVYTRLGSHTDDAYETFRRCPILEVRKKCLETMRRYPSDWTADGHVPQLERDLKRMATHNDPLWEEFMLLCIWVLKKDPKNAARTVRLIMTSCPEGKEVLRSRMMRALLPYREEVNFPLIRDFLRGELYHFWHAITYDNPWYRDEDWHRLTRALETLLKHDDYACINDVRRIAKKLGDPKFRGPLFSGGGPREDRLLLVQHRAYLHEALRQMQRVRAVEIETQKLSESE